MKSGEIKDYKATKSGAYRQELVLAVKNKEIKTVSAEEIFEWLKKDFAKKSNVEKVPLIGDFFYVQRQKSDSLLQQLTQNIKQK